jgi:hypothetical protein
MMPLLVKMISAIAARSLVVRIGESDLMSHEQKDFHHQFFVSTHFHPVFSDFELPLVLVHPVEIQKDLVAHLLTISGVGAWAWAWA